MIPLGRFPRLLHARPRRRIALHPHDARLDQRMQLLRWGALHQYRTIICSRVYTRYVAYFPYPEALPPLTGSPPGAPPGQLSWPLTVSVRYQPSAQHQLADARPTDPPELSSLLGQGAAPVSAGGVAQPDLAATLTFGSPLLLMLQVAA